ncbi:MAG: diphthine synthase [Thermoplasmatota archaeon]
MLTFVGLGLWDEQDISLRGLAACKVADRVFAEWYTAFLGGSSMEKLEALIGKRVEVVPRSTVEAGDTILEAARSSKVAFLTAGDALTATTHSELRCRAVAERIPVTVVHGASIATAASGFVGLQHYKFGRATTLVFPEPSHFPTSPYEVIAGNLERGLHTLVLLDLRAEENPDPTARYPGVAGPNGKGRFLTASEGAAILLDLEQKMAQGPLLADREIAGVARVGSPDPVALRGTPEALSHCAFGPPLHAIVVPGAMHFAEEEAWKMLLSPAPMGNR